MAFDTDLEADVLSQCMRSTQFVRRALPVLRRHDFSDRTYAWVWSVIADCYERNRELPTGRIFSVRLERDHKDDDEKEYTIKALIALKKRRPTAPKSALEEVRRFAKMAATRRAAFDALDGIDKGDVDAAAEAMASAERDLKAADVTQEPVNWQATARDRVAAYRGTIDRFAFPTPVATVNRLIGGGLWASNLGIILATTSVGKSTLAVDCGFSALFKTDSLVIHFPTEETPEECSARYDARLTGIERAHLLSGKLTDEQEAHMLRTFERRGDAIGERLLVHGIEPGQSIASIRAVTEQAREDHPDRPILVIADSADHLSPPKSMESHRLSQSALYWYLLAMAHDDTLAPIGVWSTVQAPFEYLRRHLDEGATAESKDKARTAAIMLGLDDRTDREDTDDLDRGEDPLLLWILKNRQGRVKKRQVYVSVNMGTCAFRELSNQDRGDDD